MSVQVSQTWQLIEYFNKVTYFIDRRASQHFFCFYFPQCHKFICLINTQWNVDVCTSSAIRTPITSYLFIWHFKWQISLKQATLLDQTWKAVPTWLSIRITPSPSAYSHLTLTDWTEEMNWRSFIEGIQIFMQQKNPGTTKVLVGKELLKFATKSDILTIYLGTQSIRVKD